MFLADSNKKEHVVQVRPYTSICNSSNNCRKEKYIAHTEMRKTQKLFQSR